MTESIPPILAEIRQLNRSLMEKVLDKAASDPQWKHQLLNEPDAATRGANFPETQQRQQIQEESAGDQGEVLGHNYPYHGTYYNCPSAPPPTVRLRDP